MKALFLQRSPREKVMLLIFIGLAALAWLSSVGRRASARAHEWQTVSTELAEQKLWLTNKAKIEAQSTQAIARLDPKRTLDATHLVGELNKLAGAAGLAPTIDSQRSDATDAFAFHSVQVTFRRTGLKPLIDFYNALSARSPYIGLEQFSLSVNRATPGQADVSFRVFSVEVVSGP